MLAQHNALEVIGLIAFYLILSTLWLGLGRRWRTTIGPGAAKERIIAVRLLWTAVHLIFLYTVLGGLLLFEVKTPWPFALCSVWFAIGVTLFRRPTSSIEVPTEVPTEDSAPASSDPGSSLNQIRRRLQLISVFQSLILGGGFLFGAHTTMSLLEAAGVPSLASATLSLLAGFLVSSLVLFGLVGLTPRLLAWGMGAIIAGDGPLRQVAEVVQRKSQTPIRNVWEYNLTEPGAHNAWVAGFSSRIKNLQPAIFVSRSTVDALDEQELEAVLLHEMSHVVLHHNRARLILRISVLVLFFVLTLSPVLLAARLLPGMESLVGAAHGLFAVIAMLAAARWQVRRQEYEADAYAVHRLGASGQGMISALETLGRLNGFDNEYESSGISLNPNNAHPSNSKRKAAIAEPLPQRVYPSGMWDWTLHHWRWIGGLATLAIATTTAQLALEPAAGTLIAGPHSAEENGRKPSSTRNR